MKIHINDKLSLTDKGKLLYEKTRFVDFGRFSALLKTLSNGAQTFFNLKRYKSKQLTANIDSLVQKGYVQVEPSSSTGKNTNVDLVNELLGINNTGRYDAVIENAKAFKYHEYKSNHDWPKDMLLEDLSRFHELSDLRERVRAGEFNEQI